MIQVERGPAETAGAVKCDLASEVVRSFNSACFPATGWSMLPTIWPGDTLVVEHVSPDQVRVGDVVVVGRDGKLCGHRVISIAGDCENRRWITQGDALPLADRPVMENALLGRVGYLIRAGVIRKRKRIAVPAELGGAAKLIAKVFRHSALAARTVLYLHRLIQHIVRTPHKSDPGKVALPCQG
jgi:signal peptidase I